MAAKTKSASKSKSGAARKGLIAGGNFIIDQVKMIDVWPQRHTLANISDQSEGTGGAPYNNIPAYEHCMGIAAMLGRFGRAPLPLILPRF